MASGRFEEPTVGISEFVVDLDAQGHVVPGFGDVQGGIQVVEDAITFF